ncbi:group 3 secretory phospholipase A2 isoform X4 [Poecile atricapillus]|uniref:group 3 secretory phospholipase A2 isoform X4 n=1 Tax=Poecile atricapillus TaxID=48891 RepID=UPI0027397045|nr:group 3 secretory phospholipase A2 isoform X4 [Poecile atricapillus]
MWARAALACAALCACARAWFGGAVCAREAGAAGGARYVAFLSAGTGPALVESVWAAPGRLRACWARRDPRLARAFRAACAHRPPAAPGAALRRALSALWRRRAACTDPVPPGPQRRRRRGWTLPGTLWCGAGDSAGNWSELGLFRGPDRCCREHDQCWAQITALQFNYGIRNYRLHTVSHCDCDARFRQCLLAINDTVSNIIGVTFFNLLEVPCFVLEESEECVQWHWWGGCERYDVVPLARMVQQNQYHPSLPAEKRASPTVQPPGKRRTFSRRGRRGCRCNKHLGKCEHQIVPHEAKYQLHNVDSRTLLHCNCTRRLARCLHRARDCSDMDVAVLADHIAMDCFVLELPAACSPGRGSQQSSCTTVTRAVLVPARQLKKILRRWGPLRVSSKAKHPHRKTQARGGTLCEQCQHLVVQQTPGAWPHTVLR